MSNKKKDQDKSIDSSKIKIDDAGRVKSGQPELTEEELKEVAGGLRSRGEICRIQTSPQGCGMSM